VALRLLRQLCDLRHCDFISAILVDGSRAHELVVSALSAYHALATARRLSSDRGLRVQAAQASQGLAAADAQKHISVRFSKPGGQVRLRPERLCEEINRRPLSLLACLEHEW
jgi:hypothetical protein